MKKMHNNLDEMQEQELLKIEHNGCWIAFWLLLASILVQTIAFGSANFPMIAGEWIVFMILALYLAFACIRKGIWDRHLQMNHKTNIICSLIAALALGLVNAAMIYKNYHKPVGAAAAAIIIAACTFVICLGALTLSMRITKKKQAKAEEEPDDANIL